MPEVFFYPIFYENFRQFVLTRQTFRPDEAKSLSWWDQNDNLTNWNKRLSPYFSASNSKKLKRIAFKKCVLTQKKHKKEAINRVFYCFSETKTPFFSSLYGIKKLKITLLLSFRRRRNRISCSIVLLSLCDFSLWSKWQITRIKEIIHILSRITFKKKNPFFLRFFP